MQTAICDGRLLFRSGELLLDVAESVGVVLKLARIGSHQIGVNVSDRGFNLSPRPRMYCAADRR